MTDFVIKHGDLFAGGHDCIVNAVNCVGVMGAGVALAIRRKAGEGYFNSYKAACDGGRLVLGGLDTWDGPWLSWTVINFPTMHLPGGTVNPAAMRSSMRHMRDLIVGRSYNDDRVYNIGIPALGCGIGDFNFDDLVPIVRHGLDNLPDLRVTLYQPR